MCSLPNTALLEECKGSGVKIRSFLVVRWDRTGARAPWRQHREEFPMADKEIIAATLAAGVLAAAPAGARPVGGRKRSGKPLFRGPPSPRTRSPGSQGLAGESAPRGFCPYRATAADSAPGDGNESADSRALDDCRAGAGWSPGPRRAAPKAAKPLAAPARHDRRKIQPGNAGGDNRHNTLTR
jgi:hypothetical protein